LKDGLLNDLEVTVMAGHELAPRMAARLARYEATA
jgi:carbonic anhydrase